MALEQRDPVAFEQEKASNRAYLVYREKAKIVADLVKMNGGDEPKRGEPEYKAFQKAKTDKQVAHDVWYLEAHKHGAMLVDLVKHQHEDRDANIPV